MWTVTESKLFQALGGNADGGSSGCGGVESAGYQCLLVASATTGTAMCERCWCLGHCDILVCVMMVVGCLVGSRDCVCE